MRLFLKDGDFEAFERIIEQTLETCPMRILSYCLLSNHWHLVLWPERDGDLGAFMQKLTITHARNWQVYRRRVGYGHLYQGRYKSFPIEDDEHFYQVVRYVERNALRAKLVRRAENGGSAAFGDVSMERQNRVASSALGRCLARDLGFGTSISRRPRPSWKRFVAASGAGSPMAVGIGCMPPPSGWASKSSLRPRGRPRKEEADAS